MAVRFDAAADRLTHSGAYPQTSAGWTVTAWVRIDVDRNDWSTMVRTSGGGSTVATLGTMSDGTRGPAYYTALGSVEYTTSDLSSPATGVWVPVAWQRGAPSGGSTALRVFRKPSGTGATETASSTMSATDIAGTPDAICLGGRDASDANEWLNGSLAHVRIWSAELTQAEIEAEWASSAPVRSANFFDAWKLDTATDLTSVNGRTLATQSGGSPTTTDGPTGLTGGTVTGDVAQAVETDTATAIARTKARTIAAAGSAEAAQPLARAKARAAAQASTQELAQPLARRKLRSLGQATSGAAGRVNLCPNPSADVDLTGWSGDLGIATSQNNQTAAVERVTGLAGFPKATGFRYTAYGFARSAPAAVTAGEVYSISWHGYAADATAANLGTSYLVWYNADGGDLGYENLGGFPVPFGVNFTVGRQTAAARTAPDGAVAVGLIQDGGPGCVVTAVLVEPGETVNDYADGDTAGWSWSGVAGLSASAAPPLASDAAQPITPRKLRTMGQAVETSSAGAFTAQRIELVVDVGQATSVELAQPLGRAKVVPLGQAVELGTARTVARAKTRGVAAAVELSEAAALTARHIVRVTLGQAVEDALAGAWVRVKRRSLGRAGEASLAGGIRNTAEATPPTRLVATHAASSTLSATDGGRSRLEARHG